MKKLTLAAHLSGLRADLVDEIDAGNNQTSFEIKLGGHNVGIYKKLRNQFFNRKKVYRSVQPCKKIFSKKGKKYFYEGEPAPIGYFYTVLEFDEDDNQNFDFVE